MLKTIPSTYKTEFIFEGSKLSEVEYINLDWGKGSIVTIEQADYEIVKFIEIGNEIAKAEVVLSKDWY